MSALLYRLGHFSVRRRRAVLAAWLVIVVGLFVVTKVIGAPTSDDLTLPGTGSTEATNLLAEKLPKQQYGTVPIVLVAETGKLDSGANEKAVKATVKSLAAAPAVDKALPAVAPSRADIAPSRDT